MTSKKDLSERDICTKFITPALANGGWDVQTQVRENVYLTKGRVIVRGKLTSRGERKFADYVLYAKPNANVPLAIIEAKDNHHTVGAGMQQGLGYADMLDVPFVFFSNGDAFLLHDRNGQGGAVEQEVALDAFPSPEDLWRRYCTWKGLTPATEAIVTQDYYADGTGRAPRYYQVNAINRVIEAVAKGQDRVLLVMATGYDTDTKYIERRFVELERELASEPACIREQYEQYDVKLERLERVGPDDVMTRMGGEGHLATKASGQRHTRSSRGSVSP